MPAILPLSTWRSALQLSTCRLLAGPAAVSTCEPQPVDPATTLTGLGGYASRAALLRSGVTRHDLAQAHREGRIVRLSRGIYGLGLPAGTDGLRVAAAAVGGLVSHDSAAVLWGLEMVHAPRIFLTVPRNRGGGTRARGVTLVRADVGEHDVRCGFRVTTPLRTVLDCARELPLADAVVIADSALRKNLITLEELVRCAASLRGPKASQVRRVTLLADPKAASVLESLLRVLLVENGLNPERTQFAVRDEAGELVAWVDFAYLRARLLVEADGFEFHRERTDYRKDRRRANAFCRLDWRLLRFTWEDVRFDPAYVIEAVAGELAKTGSLPKSTQRATRGRRIGRHARLLC